MARPQSKDMKKTQSNNILALLKERQWVCVEDMTKLFIVDYRRRLVDLQRIGYQLESRKCTQHNYHRGGSKEWHLKVTVPKYQVEIINGIAYERRISV